MPRPESLQLAPERHAVDAEGTPGQPLGRPQSLHGGKLAAVLPSGCLGCSCALRWNDLDSKRELEASRPIQFGSSGAFSLPQTGSSPTPKEHPASRRAVSSNSMEVPRGETPAITAGSRQVAQGALLFFGTPLVLLLFSSVGAATFAADQPIWALAGLAPVLCITAGRALGAGRRFHGTYRDSPAAGGLFLRRRRRAVLGRAKGFLVWRFGPSRGVGGHQPAIHSHATH